MDYYYLNLPKDRNLDFETNKKVSKGIMFTADRAFKPFEHYLHNAIKTLNNKQDVKATWTKIKNIAKLSIVGKLFEVSKKSFIKIEQEIASQLNIGGKVMGSDDVHIVVAVENNLVELDKLPVEDEMLFVNNKSIKYEVVMSRKPKGVIVKETDECYVIYNENQRGAVEGQEIKMSYWLNYVYVRDFKFENGEKLKASHEEGLRFVLNDDKDYGKIVSSNGIKFKIDSAKKNDKSAWWIKLGEIGQDIAEDVPGFSPLRYFFDDNVEVKDENGNKYKVAGGLASENKIVLQIQDKGPRRFTFPKGQELSVEVNTYQLKKQREAIRSLRTMPVGAHAQLVKLFEDRDRVRWQRPSSEEVEDWFVLTDDRRSGSREQREFVNKAINTPDFAILEGPPGSGKTTVILELICQLAKQGKRVLLCGSTHVAIDNVLERLKESNNGSPSLIDKFHILPVRIGDENRISDDVKAFQINNIQEDHDVEEQLLIDIANLVCGTTIGILQHPKFKKRNKYDSKGKKIFEPIVPEFDYLIIDESSKTTFQEFLVPALYAKKWVLVGDTMQLSPFTDREQIVANIESVEAVPLELQRATLYLQKIHDVLFYKNRDNKSIVQSKHNKFVLPISSGVLAVIEEELKSRESGFNEKRIGVFRKDQLEKLTRLELSTYDLIFIEKHSLKDKLHLMPETHAIIGSKKWEQDEHAFLHNVQQQKYNFKHRERGKELNNSFEIVNILNNYFDEKSWAEEIAWRVDREHQIRLTKNSRQKGNYQKAIEDLIPRSVNKETVYEHINTVASMALPSILESLSKGISGRKQKLQTTISEGFKGEDIRARKTVLKYQHRMHPDISFFPREQFYKESNALLDLVEPKHISDLRRWDYTKYPERSVWLDVQGRTDRNKNAKEVEALIRELKSFIEYAKEHRHPLGKEWSVACLTFYRGQEALIRTKLSKLTGIDAYSSFYINGEHKINIKLHTVDKFQGQEADIVFLSMVQTYRDGFMDNPNRLNVAITRAKFQLLIVGDHNYFSGKSRSEYLSQLAQKTYKI